jgi:hypothetical protein
MLQNKDQSLLLITPSMRANIHRPRQVTKSSSKVVSIEMQVNFIPPGDLVHVFKSVRSYFTPFTPTSSFLTQTGRNSFVFLYFRKKLNIYAV